MKQVDLLEGTTRDVGKSQYFTPPKLAERVVKWAGANCKLPIWAALQGEPSNVVERYDRPMRVLEPSAGNGALVRPLVAAGAEVYAIELDDRYAPELRNAGAAALWFDNFLEFKPYDDRWRAFDLCVMNPPYHDGLEERFILHALAFAARVVGIFRADLFYSVGRGAKLWTQVRPTRAAFCSRRPWKGAETDYVVLELVKRESPADLLSTGLSVEWWADKWW